MSVNRYEVTIEDARTKNFYKVFVSTVDESNAIKIAKRKVIEKHCLARDNVVCRKCEMIER